MDPHSPLGALVGSSASAGLQTVMCAFSYFSNRRLFPVWQAFLTLPEHELDSPPASRVNPAEMLL